MALSGPLALWPCLDAVVDAHGRDVLRGGHASFVAMESADVLCAYSFPKAVKAASGADSS